jgi:hypothetical protein
MDIDWHGECRCLRLVVIYIRAGREFADARYYAIPYLIARDETQHEVIQNHLHNGGSYIGSSTPGPNRQQQWT